MTPVTVELMDRGRKRDSRNEYEKCLMVISVNKPSGRLSPSATAPVSNLAQIEIHKCDILYEEMMRSDAPTCNKTSELYEVSPFITLFLKAL